MENNSFRAKYSEIERAFLHAIDYWDEDKIKFYIKQGVDPDLDSGYALYRAVWGRRQDLIEFLLESPEINKHADINLTSGEITAICLNRLSLFAPTLKYLMERGLDIKDGVIKNIDSAAKKKNTQAMQLLHENGVDLQVHNNLALRTAVEANKYVVIDYLLANGANIHVNKEILLSRSIEDNNQEMTIYLIKNGASLESAYEHSSDDLRLKIKEIIINRLENELQLSLTVKNNTSAKLKI